jgi:hypothetical protein
VNSLSVNRLLQKLAITVTHPFRRIRSFEDCLADRRVRCELISASNLSTANTVFRETVDAMGRLKNALFRWINEHASF